MCRSKYISIITINISNTLILIAYYAIIIINKYYMQNQCITFVKDNANNMVNKQHVQEKLIM